MIDDIFEVGLLVSVETSYRYYLTTHLIGWERDLFLITGIVSSAGKGPLKINDTCKIRFLKDGMAYGFETQIISVNLKPYPVMYFKYPTAIKQLTTRKFNRIKSNIQARLLDNDDHFIANATMTDLSMGGCGLNISIKDVKELAYDEPYKLDFSILETDMRLCCSLRVMTTVKETHILGMEFLNMTSDEMATIDAFLDVLTNVSASKVDAILSKLETSGATLGGHIEELPISDVLQMMDQLNKEGVLNITSDQRNGFISISNGMIMDVSMDDLTGEDALVEILALKKGGFHFIAKEVASGYIKRPINFMLIDTCRIMDERDSVKTYIPQRKERFVIQKEPTTENLEIQAITNAIRNEAASIDKIHTTTGFSYVRSGLVMATLIKDGYLKKVH